MDRIPVEILDRVFQLACIDDGSTGRSLSAVSSRIRIISARHKYYSLRVRGAKCIARFATLLLVVDRDALVQYLELDCTTPDVVAGPLVAVPNLQGVEGRATNDTIDAICSNAAVILYFLSPRLKGLYLIPATAPIILNSFIFPLLDTFFLYESLHEILVKWDSSHFPALRRLDISCDTTARNGHTSAFVGLDLPTLTHFGCCAHGRQFGIWNLLSLFAQSSKHTGGATPFAYAPSYNAFLRWNVLRVGAPSPDLPQLLARIEDMKPIVGFPSIIAREHEQNTENSMHVMEWHYVVEGGEGFLAFSS